MQGSSRMTTFTVTTTSDAGDDGTQAASLAADQADGGGLSLREALAWAADAAGADTITFAAAGRIVLAQGQLAVPGEVTIDGDLDGNGTPDVTVDGGGASRVFSVSGDAAMRGLVVTGGSTAEGGGGIAVANGGSLWFEDGIVTGNAAAASGGGIDVAGEATVLRSLVSANRAGADGGGIHVTGALVLVDGVVTGNESANFGGGIEVTAGDATLTRVAFSDNRALYGGGLRNDATATLTDVDLVRNTARNGGGIDNDGALVMTGGSIASNRAAQDGGGIFSNNEGLTDLEGVAISRNIAQEGAGIYVHRDGAADLRRTSLVGNFAFDDGGGMLIGGAATLSNVTVAGNRAGDDGGGLYTGVDATLALTNATVTGNAATDEAGGIRNRGTATVVSTIVVGNAAATNDDFSGSIVYTSRANLFGGDPAAVFAAVDPVTGGGALADHGGAVLTAALRDDPSNPALDAGDDAAAPAFDARGVARPQGGRSDIGAFELRADLPPVAADDAVATDARTPLSGDVLADNGAGPDRDPEGGALRIVAVDGDPGAVGAEVALPSGARLLLRADGTFLYDPAGAHDHLTGGEGAAEIVGYTLADDRGRTDAGTLTIAVGGVNDAPVAVSDAASLSRGEAFRADSAPGVLANDLDADGDALSVIAVAGSAANVGRRVAGAYGDLTLGADGAWSYLPRAEATAGLGLGRFGRDVFSYAVSDGAGGQGGADLTVTVFGRPDPSAELLTPDGLTLAEGQGISLTLALDDLPAGPVSWRLEGAGADDLRILQPAGRVAFAEPRPGRVLSELRIEAVADGLVEGTETFPLTLTLEGATFAGGRTTRAFEVVVTDGPLPADPGGAAVRGTSGADTILGGAGADLLRGRRGDDVLGGAAGDDVLRGGAGRDTLRGGAGDDVLSGGRDRDALRGGAGDDLLRGGAAADDLRGGGGADRLGGGRGDDSLNGGRGDDVLHGGTGRDALRGGAGDDDLRGGRGGDDLNGGAGADRLVAGRGDDALSGGRGADALRGGAGRDTLRGGAGDDDLRGGRGADVFVYDGGRDRVRDFRPGEDFVRIDPSLWRGAAEIEDLLERHGTVRGRDAVIEAGGGNVLVIEDLGRLPTEAEIGLL